MRTVGGDAKRRMWSFVVVRSGVVACVVGEVGDEGMGIRSVGGGAVEDGGVGPGSNFFEIVGRGRDVESDVKVVADGENGGVERIGVVLGWKLRVGRLIVG